MTELTEKVCEVCGAQPVYSAGECRRCYYGNRVILPQRLSRRAWSIAASRGMDPRRMLELALDLYEKAISAVTGCTE